MREILFKGKRIDTGQWIEGYLFFSWERAYILWGTTNGMPDMIEVDSSAICQYTGLTDKNGRKIFEWDIIEAYDSKAIVVWEDKNARFLGLTLEGESKIVYISREPKVKIIGNIFNYSEMPKGGDDT